jgi:hypothetical protein
MSVAFIGVQIGQGALPFFVAKLMQFPGVALFYIAMVFIAVPQLGRAMVL